jgi:REP element-mobilizing transposase RayT
LNELFHQKFRELLLHAAARERLFCPGYCLMPDHIHFIWMGMRRESDQLNGMMFFRMHLGRLLRPHELQHQACDNVLREEDRKRGAFAKVTFYILENPVRAHLAGKAKEWPYIGAVVPGYPDLHPFEGGFWETFWKVYVKSREAEPAPPPGAPLPQ